MTRRSKRKYGAFYIYLPSILGKRLRDSETGLTKRWPHTRLVRSSHNASLFLSCHRPNTSLLYTSSMIWSGGCENIEEFYNKCVGVPVQLLPTVLGVKLAVDLDLGSKYVRLSID